MNNLLNTNICLLFNAFKMISKTTSVLGLSIAKLGYDSNRGSANSKSGIG